jgi:hypothetical protein
VKFRVKNNGDTSIALPCSAPWKIFAEDTKEKELVFAPVAEQAETPMSPGKIKEWTWDQKNNHGGQVRDGMYTVVLNCSQGEFRLHVYVLAQGQRP